MRYETIKTVILTVLVIISTVLTWSIWTFQPHYETLKDEKTVQEVSLSGEQKDVRRIVVPSKISYHHQNNHFGTVNVGEIEKVMRELGRWNFDHFEEVSSELGDLKSFSYKGGNAEIVFPALVPMEIYKNGLDIKDKDAFSIQFDRIVIDTENITKEHGYVYFLSMNRNLAYRAQVTASFITNFKEDYYQLSLDNVNFSKYSLEPLTDERKLLVNTEEINMKSFNYLVDPLPTEDFRDALFNDPSFVKRNMTSSGEEFFDDSTLLSVNYDTNTILYVNPAHETGHSISTNKLLQQSIDFVNAHGGWTGSYHYVGIDEQEKTVLFRLYDSTGYPIFNNNGMSEILQIWGETKIIQYMRNNFSLGRRVETTEVTMKSGIEILETLRNTENFNPEFLQDLVLGYEMSKNSEGTLIQLEPAWYYKYKDQWWQIPSDDKGGINVGLE